MIETVEGNHSYNFDELLTYLLNERDNRYELYGANVTRKPERAERERRMSEHYQRFYDAAVFYRVEQLKETQEQLEALKAENESHKSDLKEGVNLMRELEVQNEILETEIESLKAENETQNKTVQEWIKTNRFLADNGTFELWAIEEADIPELITLIKAESLKADKAKVEAEKTCQWELDSNADYETWETSCGRSWCFEGESDLKEHGVVFCQGCGGRVIDASQLETKEGN